MSSPQVSVIMPIFKPKFLATAIDSILAQTMPDFELILINDGSPFPQTAEIGSDYSRRDPRIRYIEQANRGVAEARNAGATLASADCLMLMDDDDISHPDKMRKQFDFLRKNPEVASVGCTHIHIDGSGKMERRNRGKAYPKLRESVIQTPPPPSFSDSLYPDSLYFTPWPMIKRSAYETLGGMRPWFRSAEDSDFALRLEEKFSFAILPEPLFFYRNYSGEKRLGGHPNQVLYDYAAKYAAFCRRRGEADPINETTDLNDLLRHLPELPKQVRHSFIRRWGKSRRRSLSSENVAAIKQELAFLQQMLPAADEKKFRQMKWKVGRTALLKGHWNYFLTKP